MSFICVHAQMCNELRIGVYSFMCRGVDVYLCIRAYVFFVLCVCDSVYMCMICCICGCVCIFYSDGHVTMLVCECVDPCMCMPIYMCMI